MPFFSCAVRRLHIVRSLVVASTLLVTSTAMASDEGVDRALVDALVAEDAAAARRALESGADPNAVLGPDVTDHALCAAIDSRDGTLLDLLVEFDVLLDATLDEGRTHLRSPITCAIHYYNRIAFRRLIELGADPDGNLCAECELRFVHTPLTEAIAMSRFPMVLTLVQETDVSSHEMGMLVHSLERRPYDASHPWAPIRDDLIAWVHEQGVAFTPRPATPPAPGTVLGRCVYSVRDSEDGTGPSICPE